MSAFDKALAKGFAKMTGLAGTGLTFGGKTATCICSPLVQSHALVDSGFDPMTNSRGEMVRADFVRLGIVDRAVVQLGGKNMKVMSIEDDPADPCVSFMLQLNR